MINYFMKSSISKSSHPPTHPRPQRTLMKSLTWKIIKSSSLIHFFPGSGVCPFEPWLRPWPRPRLCSLRPPPNDVLSRGLCRDPHREARVPARKGRRSVFGPRGANQGHSARKEDGMRRVWANSLDGTAFMLQIFNFWRGNSILILNFGSCKLFY